MTAILETFIITTFKAINFEPDWNNYEFNSFQTSQIFPDENVCVTNLIETADMILII